MKKLFLMFNFLFYSFILAQMESVHWYFGEGAGLDFSSGSHIADTNDALHTIESCASISDKQSNLLFYTDGSTDI